VQLALGGSAMTEAISPVNLLEATDSAFGIAW
jgi:hypothetical protein